MCVCVCVCVCSHRLNNYSTSNKYWKYPYFSQDPKVSKLYIINGELSQY